MAYAHGYLWFLYVASVISVTYTALVCNPPDTLSIEPKENVLQVVKGQKNEQCPGLLNIIVPTEYYRDNFTQWILRVKPDPPMPCSKYAINIGDSINPMQEICGDKFLYGFNSTTRLLEIQVIFVDTNLKSSGIKLNISAEPVCGGFFNESDGITGTFRSPNFGSPDGYYNEYDCLYNFVAPKGRKVMVVCGTFDLEERKEGKCNDMFTVVGDEKAVVTHNCGHELQDQPIISDSRFLTINFQSDISLNNYTGFDCLYNFV